MASPFPGMDPYLEHPDFWPEVHSRLIVAIADSLIPQVRPKYRVAIEKRIYEINDPNSNNLLIGIPDVTIKHQPSYPNIPGNVAVAPPLTKAVTVTIPIPEEIREAYLEVRDMATGSVITAIEVLSPTNKKSKEGREKYLQKRQQVLGCFTHLVEIDLLRGGKPMPILDNPYQTDYRVLISRRNQRPKAELYAFNLADKLPCFTIPLQREDQEPILDLQQALNQVYERAGYDYIIDYTLDPVPPLSEQDQQWVKELLQ